MIGRSELNRAAVVGAGLVTALIAGGCGYKLVWSRGGGSPSPSHSLSNAPPISRNSGPRVRAPISPVPKVPLPPLKVEGDIPCGADAARAEFASFYPALVAVMGPPFTFADQGLTWRWDNLPGHGYIAKENLVRFSPGEVPNECDAVHAVYIRETAHLFFDIGDNDINFGPSWLRQAVVGGALQLAGSEGQLPDHYDLIQGQGRDKVNGVRLDRDKFGDNVGSHGRSIPDYSSWSAMEMLVQVLSGDTHNDLLRRIDRAIFDRWKGSNAPDAGEMPPEVFAQILNKVSKGRKFDGLAPGDWLLAQPFTNSNGAQGRFLGVYPFSGGQIQIGTFDRAPGNDSVLHERPLSLDVKLTLVDVQGAEQASKTVRTAANGEVLIREDSFGAGIGPGAYILKAQAVSQGQTLAASSVVLIGVPPHDEELRIILLNADGTSFRNDLASQLQVTGSGGLDSQFTGVIGLLVSTGKSVQLRLGSSHWTLSKPETVRQVLLRVP